MTSGRAEASLGTFAWFGYELPLPERLRLIKQSGFSHTFLWMGSKEPLVEAGRAHEMPGMAAKAGLAVDHVHAPYENANAFWSDSPRQTQRVVKRGAQANRVLQPAFDFLYCASRNKGADTASAPRGRTGDFSTVGARKQQTLESSWRLRIQGQPLTWTSS